jgi:PIN domain nuclease of toxin-antitoxin system
MKLLLDTHSLLWFISGDARLSSTARSSIEDASHDKFVSIASLWETAIKVSIGKIALNAPFDRLFPHQLVINGFELLPISIRHTSAVSRLPFHHRDPFDRIFVAQAIAESLSIVSGDTAFDNYGVNRLW